MAGQGENHENGGDEPTGTADVGAEDVTAAASGEPNPGEGDLAAERNRLKDQLLRTAADFENFRKRARRDVEEAERRGREDTLRELLVIIDNLERAVDAAEAASDASAVADGVRMVLKQFEDVAGRLGVERVGAVGERFDPTLHDAVQQEETDAQPPGTILKEIVPGYRMQGRLVRAAMVVVARPPAGASPGPAGAGEKPADPASGDGDGGKGAGST